MSRMTRGAASMSKRDPGPIWEDIGPLAYADAAKKIQLRFYRVKGKYICEDEYITVLKAVETYQVRAAESMGRDIYEVMEELCAPQGFDVVYIDEDYKEATILVDVSDMHI